MADGQVYVTVQAGESNPKLRSAGSNGETTLQFTITWTFAGGISGQYGWDSPRQVNYVEGNTEATNAAVYAAYQGASFLDLYEIRNCVK